MLHNVLTPVIIAAIVVVILLAIAGYVLPAVAVKIGTGILTGISLGMGFAFKDTIVNTITGWKKTIEYNVSKGHPWYWNQAMVESAKWRSDPVGYTMRERAEEAMASMS